jgi:hypothetical protein
MNEAALLERAQKIGFEGHHRLRGFAPARTGDGSCIAAGLAATLISS